MDNQIKDRVAGAVMGAFIGEAMAVGPHWYYDLDEMRADYGEITGYTDPKPGRYHEKLKAGELSQQGFILKLMIRSILEKDGYQQAHFCKQLDDNLFPLLDGKPISGPGGYTSQSIREVWHQRVVENKPWNEVGGYADTTEALERNLAIAIRYAYQPEKLARYVSEDTALTQKDDIVGAMTVAYGALLALLIQGHSFDTEISDRLMTQVKKGELPFLVVTSGKLKPPKAGSENPSSAGLFASPDALLTASDIATAVIDQDIHIEPASKVASLYGLPCAIYHQIPAVYYLSARFKDDFESAVLSAVNGGGQNMSRASLTGTLVGAQVGLSRIPKRFIDGLNERDKLLKLANKLGDVVASKRMSFD